MEDLAVLRVREVDVDEVPNNRLTVLARTGLGSKATALARMSEPRRTATLLAVARHLDAAAIDDALDLFGLLMTTRLLSPARRATAEARLAMLPRLERASKTVVRAGRVLLDALTAAEAAATADGTAEGSPAVLDVAGLWAAVETVASRDELRDALGVVDQLVPDDDGSADAALRTALAGRYNTVRPFLALRYFALARNFGSPGPPRPAPTPAPRLQPRPNSLVQIENDSPTMKFAHPASDHTNEGNRPAPGPSRTLEGSGNSGVIS